MHLDASRCISNFNDLIHVGCESSGDAKSGDFTAAPPCIQPYRAAVIDEFDRWIQDLSDSMRSGLLSKSSKFEARNSSCYWPTLLDFSIWRWVMSWCHQARRHVQSIAVALITACQYLAKGRRFTWSLNPWITNKACLLSSKTWLLGVWWTWAQ